MRDYAKLNEYLSNLGVLNANLHNLHWNVVGSQFMQIHEYTEKLYNDFFEKFDVVAEILKMKGEKPLTRLSDYVKNASIKELDGDKFSCREVLEILEGYLDHMRKLATDIRNEADEDGDFEVVKEFEDHVSDYSKQLWFVRSMLA